MKLYYSPGACSLASHIVLCEANLPFTLVKVDLKSKRTESGDDFKTINPKGYVPLLELDDGARLTENMAILQYLGQLEKPVLMPQGGMAKWHAIEALAFVSTEIHKAYKPLFDPTASSDAKAKAKEIVAGRLGLQARWLADQEYVTGDSFSVVDAYLFVMLTWAKKNEIAVPERLGRYAERLAQRPSVQRAMKEEGLTSS